MASGKITAKPATFGASTLPYNPSSQPNVRAVRLASRSRYKLRSRFQSEAAAIMGATPEGDYARHVENGWLSSDFCAPQNDSGSPDVPMSR